jgi:5'-deoxynucleotidase YfbR-like HD superfamily hydrolase
VLQASLYQTIRSGIRKVISVAAGVLVAVGVSEFIGFSWWQLALVIAGALLIGRILRLGDDLLEVPISAMLIFSSAGTHVAATGRIVDTLAGTAAGLVGGLVFAKPRVQPAREAVGTLAGRLAGLLDLMAGDLSPADGVPDDHDAASAPGLAAVHEWLSQARALREEIERVDHMLRTAADSVRLNPRSRLGGVPDDLLFVGAGLRGGLEALEHATVTVRGLARSILESTGIDSDTSPIRDEQTRARLADVLRNLAQAIRAYGRLVQVFPADSEALKSELERQLEAAHREQDELAAVLEPRTPAEGGSSEWPLRGEILTHVDRLRTGLHPEIAARPVPPPGIRLHRVRAVVRGPLGQPHAATHGKNPRGKSTRDRTPVDKNTRDKQRRGARRRGKHQQDRRRPVPERAGHVLAGGHLADLGPQRAVGLGRGAGRREDRDRRALHRHRLDDRQGGDHGARHLVAFRRQLLADLPVQLLAPVDHREERQDLRAAALELSDKVRQLLQGAHRQRGRDERHHDDVGGVQHVLRDQ